MILTFFCLRISRSYFSIITFLHVRVPFAELGHFHNYFLPERMTIWLHAHMYIYMYISYIHILYMKHPHFPGSHRPAATVHMCELGIHGNSILRKKPSGNFHGETSDQTVDLGICHLVGGWATPLKNMSSSIKG